MKKINTCTIGPKHQWLWIKNITNKKVTYSARGTAVQLSLRGLYKCACGELKEGQQNHNGPDLRELEGGAA